MTTGTAGTLALEAANNVTTGSGLLNLNGNLNSGTGTVTLTSGLNGAARNSDTFTTSNLLYGGASFGTVTIAGFQDLTFSQNLTSSGNVTVTDYGNLTVNNVTTGAASSLSLKAANGSTTGSGLLTLNGNLSNGTGSFTLSSGLNGTARNNETFSTANLLYGGATYGTVTIQGFQDMTFTQDIKSSNNISVVDFGNLSVNNVTTAAVGSVVLEAANNSATGSGLLNLNGNITDGTGALTLTSGLNGAARNSETFTASNLLYAGATWGAVTMTGFQDTTFSEDLKSTGSVSLNAFGNLTVGNVAAAGTGSMSLKAANGLTTGSGLVTINGNITSGTGSFTLTSGLNGASRASQTFGSGSLLYAGATYGAVAISGFQDMSFTPDVKSSGGVSIVDFGNLTVGNVAAASTGALALEAANNSTTGSGLLNITGNLTGGTGTFNLSSGLNGASRQSETFGSGSLLYTGATYGAVTIQGFQDMSFTPDVKSNAGVSIIDFGNLTVGNVAAAGTSNLTLEAAGNSITGSGLLNITGNLTGGTGTFTLTSGLSGANRQSETFGSGGLAYAGATYGAVTIGGFQDMSFASDIKSSGNVSVIDYGNLTVGNVTEGAASNLTLKAANGVTSGTGELTVNGNLSLGTGTLTMLSGADLGGNRANKTFDTTSYAYQNLKTGAVDIEGFNNLIFSQDLKSSGNITVNDFGNLTVGNVTTGASSNLSLQGANGAVANVGQLSITGNLSLGTGTLNLISGTDLSGNRLNQTFNTTNYTYQNVKTGLLTINGFQDLTFTQNVNTSTDLTITANHNLTMVNVTSGGGISLNAASRRHIDPPSRIRGTARMARTRAVAEANGLNSGKNQGNGGRYQQYGYATVRRLHDFKRSGKLRSEGFSF